MDGYLAPPFFSLQNRCPVESKNACPLNLEKSKQTATSPDMLGQFDPTLLLNGIYDVRLTAEDSSGNVASVIRTNVAYGAAFGIFTYFITSAYCETEITIRGVAASVVGGALGATSLRVVGFGPATTLAIAERIAETAVAAIYGVLSGTGAGFVIGPILCGGT